MLAPIAFSGPACMHLSGTPVVLDTNTVLALWMFEDPGLQRLRTALARGALRPLCCAAAIEELRRVLAYPRFGLDAVRRGRLLEHYLSSCRSHDPTTDPPADLPACRDPDDQKFLELAVSAGASLLLTRDRALLRLARHRAVRGRLRIIPPERYERELAQSDP